MKKNKLQKSIPVDIMYVNQHHVIKEGRFEIGNINTWNELIMRFPDIVVEAKLIPYEGVPNDQVFFLFPKNKSFLEKVFVKYNNLRLEQIKKIGKRPGPKVGSTWKWRRRKGIPTTEEI